MENNKIKKIVFISPMHNAEKHLPDLISSIKEQTNKNWEHIIIDDMSTDESYNLAHDLTKDDDRFKIIKNKNRKYALRNIVEVAREFQDEKNVAIAWIDGDDSLCNENTVRLIIEGYDEDTDALWTSHTWDINNINTSKHIHNSPKVDPYQHPWVSSHLKTFRACTIKSISDKNFKNLEDVWFTAGCDQALFLPILHSSKGRKFLDEICYLFRMNSSSVKNRKMQEREKYRTINLIRARGFIS